MKGRHALNSGRGQRGDRDRRAKSRRWPRGAPWPDRQPRAGRTGRTGRAGACFDAFSFNEKKFARSDKSLTDRPDRLECTRGKLVHPPKPPLIFWNLWGAKVVRLKTRRLASITVLNVINICCFSKLQYSWEAGFGSGFAFRSCPPLSFSFYFVLHSLFSWPTCAVITLFSNSYALAGGSPHPLHCVLYVFMFCLQSSDKHPKLRNKLLFFFFKSKRRANSCYLFIWIQIPTCN